MMSNKESKKSLQTAELQKQDFHDDTMKHEDILSLPKSEQLKNVSFYVIADDSPRNEYTHMNRNDDLKMFVNDFCESEFLRNPE